MGILVQLIDRVRSVDNEIIRQDVLLKTLLNAPELIEPDKLSKSEKMTNVKIDIKCNEI